MGPPAPGEQPPAGPTPQFERSLRSDLLAADTGARAVIDHLAIFNHDQLAP